MKIDILNIEWNSGNRDAHIVEPILVSLSLLNKDIVIKRVDIYLGFLYLILYKPKILLMASGVGADEKFHLIKFASKLGIMTVTLNSEGDYTDNKNSVDEFFWGWNKENYFYDTLQFVWSNRVKNYINKYIDGSDKFIKKIKTTGAVGFDRYNLLDFMDKKTFLIKNKKPNYKKVVSLAGFGFDWIIGDYYKRNPLIIDFRYGKEYLPLHAKAQKTLSNIYYELICKYPDILFIIKLHPATEEEYLTEFSKILENRSTIENILIVKNEFNIEDIINISDIWIAYESTTCMEAWLLKKTTILINPCGKEFQRSDICKGSPIYKTLEELTLKIDEYYITNKINDFSNLEKNRKELYKEIIHSNDGLNHLRAVSHIIPLLQKQKNSIFQLNIKDAIYIFKRIVIKIVIKLSKYSFFRKFSFFKKYNSYNYNYAERYEIRDKYVLKLKQKYLSLRINSKNYKDYINND
jgi:hypothetical protein